MPDRPAAGRGDHDRDVLLVDAAAGAPTVPLGGFATP
jgi:hypothetical protein